MKWFTKTGSAGRLIQIWLVGFAAFVTLAGPAHAYIGPGAGLGAVAVTIAVVLGGIFLLVGLVWFPLKRLLRGRKAPADAGNETDPAQ